MGLNEGGGLLSFLSPPGLNNKLIQKGVHKIVEPSSWFSLLPNSTVCHRAEASRRHALVRRSEWAQASQHQTVRSLTLKSNSIFNSDLRCEHDVMAHKYMRLLIPDYYPCSKQCKKSCFLLCQVITTQPPPQLHTPGYSPTTITHPQVNISAFLVLRYYTTCVLYFGLDHGLNLGSLKSCQTDCREALDPVEHSFEESSFTTGVLTAFYRAQIQTSPKPWNDIPPPPS